jgi:NAD(P)-dependent dehydrogenase (short-subunit alcohol dehydrogenase family)
MKHKPLEHQVLVVFGASSGIGRATALRAAERGAAVVAVGRDREALESLAQEAPERITVATADAADADQVARVAAEAAERHGSIDTWAHVAGVGEYARFEDMTPEEFRRVVDVDLLGPVWGAKAAIPYLRRRGGALVVVSSIVARRPFPLLSSYSASKHGVDGFLGALRLELRHERAGVSVTEIMPGTISTPFFENARSRLGVRGSGPPPVSPAETVADAILKAAEHGGRNVAVGRGAGTLLALQRIAPRSLDAMVGAFAFRVQRSKEKRSPTDDALFDAPAGDDRVRGKVSNVHR